MRIAIHQGEVVVQGDDIVGDDVNIFKQGFTFDGSVTTYDNFGTAVEAVTKGKFNSTGSSFNTQKSELLFESK